MVRAWIADTAPLYEKECYEKYYKGLPRFRKEKADGLRTANAKAQSVGAWSLWEKIRAEYGLPESSVFNLSHSGTMVMCAAALDDGKVKVGCDLEQIKDLRQKIAERFFCREEYLAIMEGRTEEERCQTFYRYWVLKESFMKATRKGMAMPLDAFAVRLGDPPVLTKQPAEFPEPFYYREYQKDGLPYKMAVCSTDENIDLEIHTELRL